MHLRAWHHHGVPDGREPDHDRSTIGGNDVQDRRRATTIAQLNERYTRAYVDGHVAIIDAMFTIDATCMPRARKR
jgi:hypothetical protein